IPANHEEPWYTHDCSVAWRQPIGATTLRASLEINNLFNQQYEVIANYPMPGRNFKLILQYDF
ncbi:MAG: TonB-dependent receptor, partial [Muribaculaceae bacterium]|nr:TonB-dependent receptor [Muribaculaceae bacterium]